MKMCEQKLELEKHILAGPHIGAQVQVHTNEKLTSSGDRWPGGRNGSWIPEKAKLGERVSRIGGTA